MALTDLDHVLAKELKLLRSTHKINQNKMVQRLGLRNQQQYSDLEKGKKHFTDELVLKICAIFNIPVLQFINTNNSASSLSVFLPENEFEIIESNADNELKITLYKKLLIEAKLEITELKLKLLHKDFDFKPVNKSIHVLI